MANSIFEMHGGSSLVTWAALVCAALAALILGWFLVRRPPLSTTTKVLLFFGIGILPIGSALTGNVVGFERTMDREFCGSCHTMTPYTGDATDPNSESLAALHTRNRHFGARSCYTCHADYGMFGTVSTKMGSMSHVYSYFTEYRSIPARDSFGRIELFKPYPNDTCMQCHSTDIPGWMEVPDHASASELIRSGELSCLGAGCHGPAHPFSKLQPAAQTGGEADE
jgi:cytochrome c-type protein NapC